MVGALIAWAIMEPTSLMPDRMISLDYWQAVTVGLLSGLFVGLLIGAAEALSSVSSREATRGIAIAAGVGAIGGVFGLQFGNWVYGIALALAGGPGIYARPTDGAGTAAPVSPNALSFIFLLIGRGFGWALIGMFIGFSQGIAKKSSKKMINGAVGGFIGGGIGGAVFEILVWISLAGALPLPPSLMGSTPAVIRFLTYGITGGSIGLFLGFIEEITKKAWLLKLVGRNEGKEIQLYKQVTTIGQDESMDIPVFGDPDVAAKHAVITAQGQMHFIEDAGSFYGTRVNGQKITKREMLHGGDLIEIGKTRFTYQDKSARSSTPTQAPSVHIPTSSHICPFCGAPKDANGNCDCTVGGAPSQPQPAINGTQNIPQQMTQPIASPGQSGQTMPISVNSGSGAKLTALSGPYSGQVFSLSLGDTIIGREAGRDIALPMDNSVSRSHARIACEAGSYVIYDTGSTNGTFVNGAKIIRQPLNQADVVQIGSTKFRFEA